MAPGGVASLKITQSIKLLTNWTSLGQIVPVIGHVISGPGEHSEFGQLRGQMKFTPFYHRLQEILTRSVDD